MTPASPPPLTRLLAFAIPCLGLLYAYLYFTTGGNPRGVVAARFSPGSMLLAYNFILEVVHDRTRLIQVSVVIVALGIAMMWWRK